MPLPYGRVIRSGPGRPHPIATVKRFGVSPKWPRTTRKLGAVSSPRIGMPAAGIFSASMPGKESVWPIRRSRPRSNGNPSEDGAWAGCEKGSPGPRSGPPSASPISVTGRGWAQELATLWDGIPALTDGRRDRLAPLPQFCCELRNPFASQIRHSCRGGKLPCCTPQRLLQAGRRPPAHCRCCRRVYLGSWRLGPAGGGPRRRHRLLIERTWRLCRAGDGIPALPACQAMSLYSSFST